jgi:hypothetical protein
MNTFFLQIGALSIFAVAVVIVAWKLSQAMSDLVSPFKSLGELQIRAIEVQKEMQERALDSQNTIQSRAVELQMETHEKAIDAQSSLLHRAIDAQKEISGSLVAPFQMVAGMQHQAIEMQGHAVEAQKLASEAQKEAATGLRVTMQRTLELSENADRSARKLSTALDTYNSKAAELDASRQAFILELAHLQVATAEIVSSRDKFLESSALLSSLDSQIRAQHQESLSYLQILASQPSVDRVQKSISDGLRQILLRDLSRTASRYPRQLRIDFMGSGLESLGKVDGGEFLAALKKVRFQLACESGNCDGKGSAFLTESFYEVKQPSYFVGTLRKVTGSSDPSLVLFDSINKFDDFFSSSVADGAKLSLHVTVRIAMTHTAAVNAVVPLDNAVSSVLDKIKKGVTRPDEVKDLLTVISKADFLIRDTGGLGHVQLGNMMERRDEERNLPAFGGLSRILDPAKGYIWVCPAHAQEFTEMLREVNR